MPELPLVSVIVPIYNVEAYLQQCLDSIVNQTYKNLEIILVNDGSTDSSKAICDEYSAKYAGITVIDTENKGAGAARNMGIKHAKGDYLYLPDSDDFIDENSIELLVDALEKHQADLVFFDALSFWDDDYTGKRRQGYFRHNKYSDASGIEMLDALQRNKEFRASIPLVFFKRNLLSDNKLQIPEGIVLEDMVFTFELFLFAFKATYLDMKLYHRRYHSNSVMTTPNWEHKYKSALEVYRQTKDVAVSQHLLEERCIAQYIANRAYNLLDYYDKLSPRQKQNLLQSQQTILKDIANHSFYQDKSLQMRCKGRLFWVLHKLYAKTIGRLWGAQ